MPNLGDFVGQLLSEMSIARMQADLETLRLAELYAAHPLLKTMAIPRVRMPEVEIDVPVLVDTTGEVAQGQGARGGLSPEAAGKAFGEAVDARLAVLGITLAAVDRTRLQKDAVQAASSVSTPAEVSVGIRPLGDAMAAAAMNVIESRSQTRIAARGDLPDGFASTLAAVARDALLQTQTPPPRLAVIATSAAIQEAAKSDAVVRFHLKLAEQGMEWTTIGGEEDQRDTLVPE